MAETVRHALAVSGLAPHRLELEIKESALIGATEMVAQTFSQLKEIGVLLALDDFGAGFCNFRYLKVLPIDCIKLDRSMLDGVLEDERDKAVVHAIVAMAAALDLTVVVEGVEQEAQREFMQAAGCKAYQGFLRAKPMTAQEFLKLANS